MGMIKQAVQEAPMEEEAPVEEEAPEESVEGESEEVASAQAEQGGDKMEQAEELIHKLLYTGGAGKLLAKQFDPQNKDKSVISAAIILVGQIGGKLNLSPEEGAQVVIMIAEQLIELYIRVAKAKFTPEEKTAALEMVKQMYAKIIAQKGQPPQEAQQTAAAPPQQAAPPAAVPAQGAPV